MTQSANVQSLKSKNTSQISMLSSTLNSTLENKKDASSHLPKRITSKASFSPLAHLTTSTSENSYHLTRTDMSRSVELDVQDHYVTENIPAEIAENWEEYFPEHEDFSREEVLFQQECVYRSIQENERNRGSTSVHSHGSGDSLEEQEGELSHGGSTNSQVALDEALARSLQELGDDFEDIYLYEQNEAQTTEANTTENPDGATTEDLTQDDVDPDDMTYEQLESLGENIGSENKGLPEELISRLPSFNYNSGIFSEEEEEECVICCMVYSSGESLINLPCAHHYHSECIKQWLSLNKQCPVCQTEVQDE